MWFLKTLLCYTVALLHTTSSKLWCLSRYYLSQNIINSPFLNMQTSKIHCSTKADRRIISQPRYTVVGRYQKQNTFVKSLKQNSNSFYTHTRKRQHKRLRIASVSSNIFEAVVANKA